MEAQGIVVCGGTGDRDRHLRLAPSPANCRQTGHPACPSSPGYKRPLPCGCGISDADESVIMDSRGLRQEAVGCRGGIPRLTTSVYGTSAKLFYPCGPQPIPVRGSQEEGSCGHKRRNSLLWKWGC